MLHQRLHKISSIASVYGKAASGGGASIATLFSAGNSTTISGTWTAASGLTFSNGVACVALVQQTGGSDLVANAVVINGVVATQLGGTTGDAADFMTLWYAPVSSGTGSITVANVSGGFQTIAGCGWMITGVGSTTPTTSQLQDNFTTNHPDPQGPLSSFVVNSGGVACFAIGSTFKTTTAVFPLSWSQATRDASTEVLASNGNGAVIGGAHISAGGTYSGIQVSGATNMQFSGLVGAAWA